MEKKLKLSTEELQNGQLLLQSERKKGDELLEDNKVLVKQHKVLEKTVEDLRTDRDAFERAFKDAKKVHDQEKEQLRNMIVQSNTTEADKENLKEAASNAHEKVSGSEFVRNPLPSL